MASGESVVLKYKVDGATSWTTIGTYDTDDAISHTFLKEEQMPYYLKQVKNFF